MTDLQKLTQSIVEGKAALANQLTQTALNNGTDAEVILHQWLIPGISQVGDLFGRGEIFLPELLMAGNAMASATSILEPILSQANIPPVGKFAIGTVKGDLHDIGKNIVVMMLKSNGWQVTDLGVDVSPEAFCKAVAESDYDILGLSTLLTTTMAAAEETIKVIQAAGLRRKVKIMVGGAPTTKKWASMIQADAHAEDAAEAVTVATNLKKS